MHKFRINSMRLNISVKPVSPLLIKSGGISANPLLPDMQFVRTWVNDEETIYIPGSSLKGTFRSFLERTLRGINSNWACDLEGSNCGKKLKDEKEGPKIYRESCLACKMFGNTKLKGRVTVQDAYPEGHIRTETRYGVSISRLSQGVAHGPFDTEVAVSGIFRTQVSIENFETWQLGGLAFIIDAVNTGIVRIGFGKNRGFGHVLLTLSDIEYSFMGSLGNDTVGGIGVLVDDEFKANYGLRNDDAISPVVAKESELRLLETVRHYDFQQWKEIASRSIEKLKELT